MTTAVLPTIPFQPLDTYYSPRAHHWPALGGLTIFDSHRPNGPLGLSSLKQVSKKLVHHENTTTIPAPQYSRLEIPTPFGSYGERAQVNLTKVLSGHRLDSTARSVLAKDRYREYPSTRPLAEEQVVVKTTKCAQNQLRKDISRKAQQEVSRSKPLSEKSTSLFGQNTYDHCDSEPFPILCSNDPIPTAGEKAREPHLITDGFEETTDIGAPEVGLPNRQHGQRLSNASSGFVRTIKTASMSNTSFSVAMQSLESGGSSEHHGRRNGVSRHSMDSENRIVRSMVDEAALLRGAKRRAIINELVWTEESYVADLKALSHLYSTLMVPASVFTSQLRWTTQQTVSSLLHVHELLLADLHQARLKSAARCWSGSDVKYPKIPYRQANESQRGWDKVTFGKAPQYTRNSIDSAEFTRACVGPSTADSADIFDLIHILNMFLQQPYAYEEYCASHKQVIHELKRHAPFLWSTCGPGIEALNKSVIALSSRARQNKKCMTMSDLLIKPVQRICRYSLLLEDLIRQTPVIDSPIAHEALQDLINRFAQIVHVINVATDDRTILLQVQRKWMLQDRLILSEESLSVEQFQDLGLVQLVGVLHLIYRCSTSSIEGSYAACILFDNHFLIAVPAKKYSVLEPLIIIPLHNLKIVSAADNKGLQSFFSPHTWKVEFNTESAEHEALLSACSKEEEEQWKRGLQGSFRRPHVPERSTTSCPSRIFKSLQLKKCFSSLDVQLSKSPAKDRDDVPLCSPETCEIVLHNTCGDHDLWNHRNMKYPDDINARSDFGVTRAYVLSPKRVERTRLENSIAEIYTKDRLPFPGMMASKGNNIIRSSAGSLVRKFSFASMQASFSRRSMSSSSKRSSRTVPVVQPRPRNVSTRRRNRPEHSLHQRSRPRDLPELETMDSLIERMIGGETPRKRLSFSNGDKLVRKATKHLPSSEREVARGCNRAKPEMTPLKSQGENHVLNVKRLKRGQAQKPRHGGVDDASGSSKKRWSNPIAKLRSVSGDGFRSIWHVTR